MSDFPRGWTLTADVTGAAASIVVPGIAGVAHVLDAITAEVTDTIGGPPGLRTVTLTSSDGVFAGRVLARLNTIAANTSDSANPGGLELAAGPGASLTVAFSQGAANVFEFLMIQGHDV